MTARLTPCIWGLGDGIWLLPILKALHKKYEDVYVETPWPQLYWNFPWIHPLKPSNDSPYARWPMFQESIESFHGGWAESPEGADVIPVCQAGDYTTRIMSFYDFDGPCDLSFRLKFEWIEDAVRWITSQWGEDTKPPRILMHIPMRPEGSTERGEPLDKRVCDPRLFCELFERYRDKGHWYDAQRVVKGECEPVVHLPMPIYYSDGGKAPMMWALAALADVIITTDNHMLPLALAMKRPTLYLEGGVHSVPYLFDPRIDRSRVEIVKENCTVEEACAGFERILTRSRRLQGLDA